MSATKPAINRRDFLKTGAAVGGGLLISLYLPELARATEKLNRTETEVPAVFAPNAFIRIGSDDIITVSINKSKGRVIHFPANAGSGRTKQVDKVR